MFYRLDKTDYKNARPLFRALEFHLTSAAVLDGNNPGLVVVDDQRNPQSAFMLSPEGCYLAGRSDKDAFNRALGQAIREKRILDVPVEALWVICATASWEKQLADLVAPFHPAKIARRHYVCRALKHDWRAHLPDGFEAHRLDEAFLNRPGLTLPDHIKSWMEGNWGSTADFLQRGFGTVTLCANECVAWSLADCRSGDACEIGIQTAKPYRRRGLAAITAAAAAEYALSHGFSRVGWQCSEDNLGSIGTAEKVGFVKERNYTMYGVSLNREE
jgi:RimJ/RimL family protein N-acetyltransferase